MIHKFEQAGLGKAPFTLVGCYEDRGPRTTQVAPGVTLSVGSPGQPMGTCDFCGQGIAHVYVIQSADNKKFNVGCDCVMKTYRDNLQSKPDDALLAQVKKQKKEVEYKARKLRERMRILDIVAWFKDKEVDLDKLPNPKREGESRADQMRWFLSHAGYRGITDLHSYLVKLLEG